MSIATTLDAQCCCFVLRGLRSVDTVPCRVNFGLIKHAVVIKEIVLVEDDICSRWRKSELSVVILGDKLMCSCNDIGHLLSEGICSPIPC